MKPHLTEREKRLLAAQAFKFGQQNRKARGLPRWLRREIAERIAQEQAKEIESRDL